MFLSYFIIDDRRMQVVSDIYFFPEETGRDFLKNIDKSGKLCYNIQSMLFF